MFFRYVFLRAPAALAKTASRQNLELKSASGEVMVWEGVPRLGVGDGAVKIVSDCLHQYSRQLHPDDVKWIKGHAKEFAKQQKISETEAEKRLALKAFREVQFGVEGQTDEAARTFLLSSTQGMMLPGDLNIAGQNMGYMFRAIPEQKANALMYATDVFKSPETLAFYAKNQLIQPTIQQIRKEAEKYDEKIKTAKNLTLGAGAAAVALTVPPALSWCLSNLVACNRIAIAGGEIIAGDALGPAGLGIAGMAGVKAVKTAEEVNAAMRAKELEPAWSSATPVVEGILERGTKVQMIVNSETAQMLKLAEKSGDYSKVRLGGWATFDDVASEAVDLRQRAAITYQFKEPAKGPFYVVELEVQKPLPSNVGFAGPQQNKMQLADGSIIELNSLLRGGASQTEFLIPPV